MTAAGAMPPVAGGAPARIVLEAEELRRHYTVGGGLFRPVSMVRAVDGVSFRLRAASTLAVVGESGCGKSTLARMVALVEPPTSGSLRFDGRDVAGAGRRELKDLRRKVQMVFQNPYGSLNPRKRIGAILEEPLAINTPLGRAERRERARDMMARVGLRADQYDRYPHMFSGGQRQIGRAHV